MCCASGHRSLQYRSPVVCDSSRAHEPIRIKHLLVYAPVTGLPVQQTTEKEEEASAHQDSWIRGQDSECTQSEWAEAATAPSADADNDLCHADDDDDTGNVSRQVEGAAETALEQINRCRHFVERIAQTASMQPSSMTATETNLSRLLQQAMLEIRLQLDGVSLQLQNGIKPKAGTAPGSSRSDASETKSIS
mmetsp:Transcript_36780/g.103766  ORF Transcript_36780/g.103766 Transcript_36780/m.103766 type:complete len:192 (+) Transcript_36780:260-835(+)|eukprot:CAMPEP_0117648970 /NCGR_PEP_ID=MMETSP0804-20121206/710_1 /TAXON_ID=1074897 /ORGANISM="Tetraselmis astigmatica, Strain CCMP880" /LENGTH=191 /DNA_ID=CAMNT_0005454651 /DNA_START=148 /DNA_END=723 /DNA_ORIENTATION=+